jgi:hypothetical protein
MSEGYDIAQICLNGHLINSSVRNLPEDNQPFCDECGESTITECQECKSPIRGYCWGTMSLSPYIIPKFCLNCGKPFEWTNRKLNAAKELASISEGFSESEIIDFQNSIDSLVRNAPNVEVAKVKYKRYAIKAGKGIAQGIRDILVDIVSESIKKTILGG